MLRKTETGLPEIVRALSPSSIEYFTGLELSTDWDSWEKATDLKFVRLGAAIFIGSKIRYGEYDTSLMHMDIANQGFLLMTEEQRSNAMSFAEANGAMVYEESLEHYNKGGFELITDAGTALIKVD